MHWTGSYSCDAGSLFKWSANGTPFSFGRDRDLAAPLSVHLAWGLRYSSKPTKVSQSIFRGDQANAGHRLRPDLTKTQHERTLHFRAVESLFVRPSAVSCGNDLVDLWT
jgi:hypothetical protein